MSVLQIYMYFHYFLLAIGEEQKIKHKKKNWEQWCFYLIYAGAEKLLFIDDSIKQI